MSTIEFGLMLQPFPTNFPGPELFEYNRRFLAPRAEILLDSSMGM